MLTPDSASLDTVAYVSHDVTYRVKIRGQEYGPFGVKRLQEFVDRGQIEPTTYLVATGDHRIQASAVPLLRFQTPSEQADPDPDLLQRFGSTAPKPFLMPSTEALAAQTPQEESTQLLRQDERTDPGYTPPSLAEETTQLLQLEVDADESTSLDEVDLDLLEGEFARREVEKQAVDRPAQGTKPCPFCEETIQAAAIKCRYCAEWL